MGVPELRLAARDYARSRGEATTWTAYAKRDACVAYLGGAPAPTVVAAPESENGENEAAPNVKNEAAGVVAGFTALMTTDQVAARLSSTPRRVRALCYQGRIEGAFQQRSRVGKPWKIPAHLQPDGTYKVKVKSGARGPALRAVSGLVRLNQVPF